MKSFFNDTIVFGLNQTTWRDLVFLLLWFCSFTCTVVVPYSLFTFTSCANKKIDCKGSTKTWIIIDKRHLLYIWTTAHTRVKEKTDIEASVKWKEVKGKSDKINELILKTKLTWTKDLITYNSHPWIIFSFNWLVIIWRRRDSFEIGRPRSIRVEEL